MCGTLWRHKLSSTETGHHCGVGKLSSGPGPCGAHGTCERERAGSTSGHACGGSTVHVFTSRLTNWVSITELQQGSVKVTRPSPPRTQVSSSPSRGHLHTGDVGLSARLGSAQNSCLRYFARGSSQQCAKFGSSGSGGQWLR